MWKKYRKTRERKEKMNRKRKYIAAGFAVMMIMAIGTAFAYFTDTEIISNSFTVGNVSVQLEEPGWDAENGKNITPGREIAKDPQAVNDGVNPAYIFMEVNIPKADIRTANDDGSVNEVKSTELFSYAVEEGWVLADRKVGEDSVTYVYGYAGEDGVMTRLGSGERTVPVFRSVKFVNAVEGQLERAALDIDVSCTGIQAEDLETDSVEGVYRILTSSR